MEPSSFDLTPAEREALGRQALALVLDSFARPATEPVYPRVDADELAARFHEPLPRTPCDGEAVLAAVGELVAPACRDNAHPRMFGYISSAAAFMAVLGDLLASALNQNVTSWRSAPGATTVERLVVDWIGKMLGYPAGAGGLLLSGGSMANFSALLVALRARAGLDVAENGVRALPRAPVIYASSMAHMSIPKAAGMLGLGRRAVRTIPVTDAFVIDLGALERAIVEDRAAGYEPIAVVANAGDVNTGAIDPLEEVAGVCQRHGLWCHVDAAYGGFAAMAPSARARLAGLARADSIALDPHKWLFMPLDAGCLLVRDAGALRAAFTHGAEYMDVLGSPSSFAFWDYGPELSRRFRALKLWLTIKRHGADAIAAAIERNLQLARALAGRVEAAPDFELLAPVSLSIVCFRYVPAGLRQALGNPDADRRGVARAEIDALNRAITVEIQRGGADVYLSNANVGGVFALRACLVNYRTRERDLDALLDTIRRVAKGLSKGAQGC